MTTDPRDQQTRLDRQRANVLEAAIRLKDEREHFDKEQWKAFREQFSNLAEAIDLVTDETIILEAISDER